MIIKKSLKFRIANISLLMTFLLIIGLAGATLWVVNNQTLFDQGTYNNTEFNTTSGALESLLWNNTSKAFPNYGASDSWGMNTSGLVLLYHFDDIGDTNVANDSTGYGNIGYPLYEAETSEFGKIGRGFDTTDTRGVVTIPDSPLHRGMTNLTISLWFNMTHKWGTDSTSIRYLVNKMDYHYDRSNTTVTSYGLRDYYYRIYLNGTDYLYAELYNKSDTDNGDDDNVKLISTDPLSTNKWYHIAVTYNGTNASLWINGQINTSSIWSGAINNYSRFGAPIQFNTWALNYTYALGDRTTHYYYHRNFGGVMDEFAIWNTTLNATNISWLYNSGSGINMSGTEDGLVGLWKFEETNLSNVTTRDYSGNNFHGKVIGAQTTGDRYNIFRTADHPGEFFNRSFRFGFEPARVTAYYEDLSDVFACDNNYSIELWYKRNGTKTNYGYRNVLFTKFRNYTSHPGYYPKLPYDDVFYLEEYGNGANRGSYQAIMNDYRGYDHLVVQTSSLYGKSDNWDHIVATVDNGNHVLKIYVNGELEATDDTPAYTCNNYDSVISIGGGAGAYVYTTGDYVNSTLYDFIGHGNIDEFAIWNRTLSYDEIQEHYYRQISKYGGNYIGNYTSKIYDAGIFSQWDNVSIDWNFNGSLTGKNLPNFGGINSSVHEPGEYGVNMSGNILLWHFDNDSAYGENDTKFYDYSGLGHNGTFVNDADGGYWGGYKMLGNNSVYFDGWHDFVTVPHTDLLDGMTDITGEAWVRPRDSYSDWYSTDTYEYDGVLTKLNCYYIILNDGRVQASVYTLPTAGINCRVDDKKIDLQTWNHVAFSWSASTNKVKVYLNGEKVKECNLNGDTIRNYPQYNVSVGRAYPSGTTYRYSTLNGWIDEVALYNRTLADEEIENRYKRGAYRLNLSVRSCDDASCNGESWIDVAENDTQNISVTDNRYFQYSYRIQTMDNSSLLYHTPKIYNVTVGHTPLVKPYWLRTYNANTNQIHKEFAVNDTVRIKLKSLGPTPRITLYNSTGDIVVSDTEMTNETVVTNELATWYYDTIVNSTGYYDISFSGTWFNNTFYTSKAWQNNWTDGDGLTFPFRILLNVSEANVIDRYWDAIDIPINLTYKSNNNSVRVVYYNESDWIYVPCDMYNITYTNGYIDLGNIVFLASMNRSENRTYYVYYSRSDIGIPDYINDTTFTSANISGYYEINNSEYRLYLNSSKGGVIQSAYSKRGSNTDLSGYTPMQISPEVRTGPINYDAYTLTTPKIGLDNSTLVIRYNTSGEVGNIIYNMSYKFYAHSPYVIVETNVTPKASEMWSQYYDDQFFVNGTLFLTGNYKNSTGIYNFDLTAGGDGTDYISLGDLKWSFLYSNDTADGIGTIYISRSQSQSYTPNVAVYDDILYEYYNRNQYTGSVSSTDYFYSKNAIGFWDAYGNDENLNNSYYQILNPLNLTLGSTQTNDTIDPEYSNTGYIPSTINDTSNVTCYGYFTDNLEIDYVVVNVTSRGYNNATIYYIASNESWVNRTVSASDLEAGPIDCKFTAYDIAGRTNTTNFTFDVTDLTPPYFTYVNNSPYTSAGLDPDVQINISANLTEYNNISTARLQYRKNSSCSWINQTLTLSALQGYVSVYNGSFTPDAEDTWQYRIATSDNQGNSNASDIQNLSVAYDWTWNHTPSNFSAVSGLLGENISIGNIEINNTGDKGLFFKITSNWDDKTKIFFNLSKENSIGYNFTLEPGYGAVIPVKVTAKSTERSDDLTITINPQNSSSDPSSNTTTTSVVSYAGGPFPLVTVTQYNLSVTQGDTGFVMRTSIQNKGNETSTNTWVAYSLPSGWTITSGYSNNTALGDLTVDQIFYDEIVIDVGSSATAGTQTITVTSGCSENKTDSDSISVDVNEYEAATTTTEDTASGGGGAAGGMGGGASASQRAKLFQTEETYELIRGQDQSFILKVENPYEGVLENVTVTVAGFLEQYLRIEPSMVSLIPRNGSYEFVIYIEAPDYFTKGIYDLNFTIDGTIKKPVLVENKTQYIKTKLKESRVITLEVHEVSKEEAMSYINLSLDLIADMESLELYTLDLEYLREDLLDYLEDKDYESARDIYNQILDLKEKAFSTLDLLEEVESNINLSIYNGIDVSKTQRLALLARAALARGDYSTALQRADDAKITYALETAGKFNVVAYVKNNFFQVTGSLILIIIFSYLSYLTIKLKVIQYKIKQYRDEENVILGLIRETQRECFEKRKMSMKEYTESLMQYENRMSKIVKESIKLETIKINLFKLFKGKKKRFLEEKDRVLNLIKETQILYMKGGNIETSIYKNRMKSYTERLAELEENLANIEAREAMGEVTSKIKIKLPSRRKISEIKLGKK